MRINLLQFVGKLFILCLVVMPFGVAVSAQSLANFTADNLSGCSPLKVKFTDASTGTITKRNWKLDANLIVTDSLIVSTTYLTPGNYPVTLTVTDNNGVTNTKTVTIAVYALPKVNYTYSDSIGCINFDVKFNNLSTPGDGTIIKTTWVFGDGFSEDNMASAISHTYTTPGKGDVTLVVTNSHGCINSLSKVKMEALALPKLEIKSSLPVTNCVPPLTVTFYNKTLNNGPLTYIWKFGDATPLLPSSDKQVTHIFNQPGSFQVLLIAANASCRDSVKLDDLIVIKKPKADFTLTKDTVCEGAPVNFTNTTNPSPTASTWVFGDDGNSSFINPDHTYSKAGTYTIKLVATVGDCTDSTAKKIVVIASPVCSFQSDGTYSCTKPFTTNFKNTSTGGATYLWDFGDKTPTTVEKDPTHVYDTLGAHTITLKVTNSLGCSCTLTKNKYIVVNDPKIVKLIITRDETPPLTFQHSAVITTIADDSIASYTWDFGDGTTSNLPEPKHTYATAGNYNVTLTVKTKNGCPATIKIIADASGTDGGGGADGGATGATTVCSSIPIQFNDKSPKADKWKWYFGDGDTSEVQNPLHKYNKTGTFTVTLKVWYQGSFMGVKVFTNYITINTGGISKFNYSRDCSKKNEIKFINLSTGADTYLWKFGDGTTSAVPSPTHTYAVTGVYKITLIVKSNTSSCVDSSTVTLGILNEMPDFKTSDTAFCKLKTIIHTPINSNSANIYSYSWNFGDGNTGISYSYGPAIAHTYNQSGVFDIQLVIKDTVGCADTLVKKAFIKVGGPVADFTPSATIGCTPLTVTFKDASTADSKSPIKKWIWDYGDGSTADTLIAPPYKHIYNKTSAFTTRLTIIDTFGCAHFKDVTIQSVKPKASFTTTDTAECPGNPIQFTNTSYGAALKYKWYFGDDSISSNPATYIEHIYKKGNNYIVSLAVTDQYGCTDSFSLKTPIRIYQPKAAFSMSDSVYSCPVAVIKFKDLSKNPVYYRWDFGDGNQSELQNPSNAYSRADTFNIKLIITSIGGCRDSASHKLIVKGPSGKFNIVGKVACAPSTLNVSANAKNTKIYTWDFNDGSTTETTVPNASHTYRNAGTFRPKLILDDGAGCKITLSPDSIVSLDVISADFKADPILLCDSGLVTFTNLSEHSGKVKYQWTFGVNNKKDTATNPTYFYKKKGFYTVKLRVISVKGCIDSVMKTIEAPFLPKATIKITSKPCLRDTQRLKAALTGTDSIPVNYLWDLGDNTNPKPTTKTVAHLYKTAGIYKISLTISNHYGCVKTIDTTLTIDEARAKFTADKKILCDSGKVTFTNKSIHFTKAEYLWDFGNGTTQIAGSDSVPVAFYNTKGFYTVKLTVTTALGCKATITKKNFIAAPFLPVTTISQLSMPCLRDTQKFEAVHATTDTIPISYRWYYNNLQTSTAKSIAFLYAKTGNHNLTLVFKNHYGCVDTLHKTVVIDDAVADFKANKVILCDSGKIDFTNLSAHYTKANYQWNLGNGVTDTLANPSTVYAKGGFYNVTLKIVSALGCRDSVTKNNFIIAPFLPQTAINSITPPCLRDTQRFEAIHTKTNAATDSIPLNYLWNFGNGKQDVKKSVALLYDKTGKYNITLTLKNHYGCVDTLRKTVIVDDATADFKANKVILCDSGKIDFINLSAHYTKANYQWSLGNGITDTLANPSTVYAKGGFYNVTLKVVSALGCRDSITKNNFIIAPFLPQTAINSITPPCLRDTQRFEAIHTKTNAATDSIPLNYLWDFGNGKQDTKKAVAQLYDKTGKYNITLTLKNHYGCVDTLRKTVIVDDATADFKANKVILCDSGKIDFTNLSAHYTKANYQWNLGNGITDTLANPSTVYSKGGFYNVTLKVVSALGCKDSITKNNFIIAPFLPQTAINSITPPCLRDTQRFEAIHTKTNAATDSIPLNYLWDFGNGKQDVKKSVALLYDKTGKYNITLTLKNHYGCVDTLRKTVIVDDATADFKANKVILCDSGKIDFTNLSAHYTKANYQWSLGNGVTDTLANPSTVYAKGGFYNVTLKIVSALGCRDSITKNNFIIAPFLPQTDINSITPPCLRDTQRFEAIHTKTNAATDSIPLNYLWDFGNGKQDTKKVTAQLYPKTGEYKLTLTVTNRYGCADTLHKHIIIDDAKADFKASKLILCDSDKINFTNLSTHYTKAAYEWSFSNNSNKDTTTNASFVYTKKGVYTVKLKITSAQGCVDSVIKTDLIRVSILPKVSLASNDAACLMSKIDFKAVTDTKDTTLSYFWDFKNGHTDTTKNHSEIFIKTGLYNVMLVVKSDKCADTLYKPVNIYPNPIALVTPKDTTLCAAKQLQLHASGGTKYSWTPALDLTCDTCATTTANPSVTRTYVAKIINQYNCFSVDSVKVNLKKSPKVLVNDDGNICIGESYQLHGSGADAITWTPAQTLDNPKSFNPIAKPSTTTVYNAIGSNKNDCPADTAKVKVIVHELPALDAGQELNVLNGDSVKLIAKGSKDIITWNWQPDEGLSCNNCPSPTVYLTNNKKFTVTATSKYGCVATDEVQVNMICQGNIVYIPNSFTPNGDGINDIFYIKGKGMKNVRSLSIYNRWGLLVFERNNFNIDDPSQGWDGRVNGEILPMATFVYLIEMECENNQPVHLQGIVTLIR